MRHMQPCPTRRFILTLGLLLVGGVGTLHGVIIPPTWANHTLNPCASKSWQLLHWPEDSQCYNIFTQGPCLESQEIYFNENIQKASCRCSRGSLWHEKTRRCHQEHSKGPCKYKEFFAAENLIEKMMREEEEKPQGNCRQYGECPPGQLFWPKTGKCFPHLSRGPCLQGHLLHIDPKTGSTACGCNYGFMSTNYWPHGDSCHELFTRGPCVQGHIFLYNLTLGATQCQCGPNLVTNYHQETDRCFELNTTGPCRIGQVFTYDAKSNTAQCQCIDGYIEWELTGQCYRSYTRGPCLPGHFLNPNLHSHRVGSCVRSSCNHGELYDPVSEKCYSVGRRGPCPRGKLWVFERANSVQGSCHCDPHLIGYWEPHGVCYELGETGPCPKRRVLTYERQTGNLKCRCDIRRGFVPWANGRCIKAGVRRDKLIPIAGPIETSERGNFIYTDRVHRGLTLPEHNKINETLSLKRKSDQISPHLQEGILKDIFHTIHNISLTQSRSSTSVKAEVSKHFTPSISIKISSKDQLNQTVPTSTPEMVITTTDQTNSKEEQGNLIENSNQSSYDDNPRFKAAPLRRRLSMRNNQVNYTRRRIKTNSRSPRHNLDVIPASRTLRKRMMGRKDIPELVMRQNRRRL